MMRTLLRAVVAALAAVALVAAGCGGDDEPSGGGEGGLEKTSLKVGILTIGDLVPFWAAQERGYFKDEGLKVTEQEAAGGAAIQPAVKSGDLDLGWSNIVSVVLAKSQNLDFKFFGGGAFLGPGHYKNQAVMVQKGSEITDPSQLEGKTIGVNTLNNINHLSMLAYLDEIGVDPKSVKFLELGNPNTIEGLEAGRVDAVTANEPFVTISLQTGVAEALIYNPYESFGEEPFLAGFVSTPEWLEENPKTAAAFTRAVDKGIEWVNENPKGAERVLVEHTEIKPELAGQIVPSVPKQQIEAADIEPWIAAAKEHGMTEETFPASELLQEGAK
jgi:NitT/TauT family transport system substrate-binding protein